MSLKNLTRNDLIRAASEIERIGISANNIFNNYWVVMPDNKEYPFKELVRTSWRLDGLPQATGNGGSVFNNGRNGGESNPLIVGNQFAFSKATNGNAIFNDGISGSAIPEIYHNTVYNDSTTSNTSLVHNQSANPIVTNNIIWGVDNPYVDDANSTSTVSHSIVQGNFSGTGVLDEDPQFISTMAPLYKGILDSSSPTFDRPVGDQSSCTTSPQGIGVPY